MPASTLCKALTVVAIVFAVAFVIVGGILPMVLDNVINSSVRSSLIVSPSDQSAMNEKYTKWVRNDKVNIDYFWFNITNKADALATGAKLIVKEVGPYSYMKIHVKYNVTFSGDSSEVRYQEWVYYTPNFQNGKDPTVDMVTQINLPWLLAIGQTAFLPTTIAPPVFDEGDNDQVSTFFYGVYTNVLAQVAPVFLNEATSPFLAAVRLNLVPIMIRKMAATVGDKVLFAGHFSLQRSCTDDANCTTIPNTVCLAQSKCVVAGSNGLELHTDFSTNANNFLLGSSSDFSFQKFSTWAPYLAVFAADNSKIANTSYWPPSLVGVFTIPDMASFVTWVATVTSLQNPLYRPYCKQALNDLGIANVTAWKFDAWSDYGLYQFGTGGIVFLLTNNTALRSITVLSSALPAPPEPFNIGINDWDYSTCQRMLSYTTPVAIGMDIVGQLIKQLHQRYMYYMVTQFFMPVVLGKNGGMFTTQTVHSMLWGYRDLAFNVDFPGWAGNTTTQDEDFVENQLAPNVKFTGAADESLTGQWKVWSNQSALTDIRLFPNKIPACSVGTFSARAGYSPNCSLWASAENLVGTSDGTSMAPFKEGNAPQTFRVYVSEAYRVVNFLYQGDVEFQGITLHNYTIDEMAMMNATSNPSNAKYYMFSDPDLIIPIQRYYGGVDLFLTYPHFLTATAATFAKITAGFNPVNLAPDYNLHQPYLLVEPITGLTMKARKRLMLGAKLSPLRLSPMEIASPIPMMYAADTYAKLWNAGLATNIYLPVMWVQEHAEISQSDSDKFADSIYKTRKLAKGIQIGFVIFGGLALVVIVIFFYRQSKSTTS